MNEHSHSSVHGNQPMVAEEYLRENSFHRRRDYSCRSCYGLRHLNPDERQRLRDCNRNYLIHRAIPFATGFGLLAYVGVQRGFLKANKRFGAIPKILLASTLGYFIGKFSHRKACVNDILNTRRARETFAESQQGNHEIANEQQQGSDRISPTAPEWWFSN